MTSAEREYFVFLWYIHPSAFGFSLKKYTPQLMKSAPVGVCHLSGWIQTYIFTDCLKHFIDKTKKSKNDPILLILDGHYSHTKNIEAINLARKYYVSFPPHSTHNMQPLGKTHMGSLKAKYSGEVRRWIWGGSISRHLNLPTTQSAEKTIS